MCVSGVCGSNGWIGTGAGSVEEVESRLQYMKPDGHKAEFFIEFDKHTDTFGEKQRSFDFQHPLLLPAGTIITLHHNAGFPMTCPCGSDIIWRFYTE